MEGGYCDNCKKDIWINAEIKPGAVYKLSNMWKGWYRFKGGIIVTPFFNWKEEVTDHAGFKTTLIAITRADAQEFTPGEGL